MIPVPAGEEVAPKVVRLLYFVGAGVLCTAVINKWRDFERKSMIQKQQQMTGSSLETPSHAEEMGDDPLAMVVKSARRVGESCQELVRVMEIHSLSLACILVDADKLRLKHFQGVNDSIAGRRPSYHHQEASPLYSRVGQDKRTKTSMKIDTRKLGITSSKIEYHI